MPLINRIHEEYKDKGLVVVGVLVDANKKELQPLVSELGIRFDQVIDAGQVFADRYHVKFTPYHILFDPDGQVIKSDIDSDELVDTIRKYL